MQLMELSNYHLENALSDLMYIKLSHFRAVIWLERMCESARQMTVSCWALCQLVLLGWQVGWTVQASLYAFIVKANRKKAKYRRESRAWRNASNVCRNVINQAYKTKDDLSSRYLKLSFFSQKNTEKLLLKRIPSITSAFMAKRKLWLGSILLPDFYVISNHAFYRKKEILARCVLQLWCVVTMAHRTLYNPVLFS